MCKKLIDFINGFGVPVITNRFFACKILWLSVVLLSDWPFGILLAPGNVNLPG
mgnify:CR=1 FL=1